MSLHERFGMQAYIIRFEKQCIPVATACDLYVLILLYLIFSIKGLTKINNWILLGVFAVIAACGQAIKIPYFEISRVLY